MSSKRSETEESSSKCRSDEHRILKIFPPTFFALIRVCVLCVSVYARKILSPALIHALHSAGKLSKTSASTRSTTVTLFKNLIQPMLDIFSCARSEGVWMKLIEQCGCSFFVLLSVSKVSLNSVSVSGRNYIPTGKKRFTFQTLDILLRAEKLLLLCLLSSSAGGNHP